MNLLPLIEAKREGRVLAAQQLQQFIIELPALPDYQVAALLMAVYFRGLNADETAALTLAMRDSGDVLNFPEDPRPLVDKHSTGGVGDKVSLPLAPLLASLGFRVPMISGRGLGITGGTLDKLESIPGFKVGLSAERIRAIVQEVGCVICGQTDRMVPADKRLYALRDVTGTVPSIPLITASILSKKLAESLKALVLDVKFGSAAFMQSEAEARNLAESMVSLGTRCGMNVRAVLTDMNVPLGRTAGNWLEVKEAVECLEGRGPDDLRELVVCFAAHLLLQTGQANDFTMACKQAQTCLASGEPRRKWNQMLAAQGADMKAFESQLLKEQAAPVVAAVRSDTAGFVQSCDARAVGELVRDLGGGRLTKESKVDPSVGVDQLAKVGEAVRPGTTLGRVHAGTPAEGEAGATRLRAAFQIGSAAPAQRVLIQEVLR